MKYRAAYHTDVGIKKKNNQDSLAIKIAETPNGQAAFAIICDGMGGLAKGELESKEVINAYCGWFEHDFVKLVRTGTFNTAILKKQWDRIAVTENEKLKAYGESRGIMIGTTLSAILMYEDRYYIIHVGDSRVYELTDKMEQLTQDQTLVAREIAAGRLTPEQAETDSRRSILLQCVGASPVVEPDFIRGYITQNASYLLCSDGFRHKISGDEIMAKLSPLAAPDEDKMKEGCIFLTDLVKYRKETDNITVLLVKAEKWGDKMTELGTVIAGNYGILKNVG